MEVTGDNKVLSATPSNILDLIDSLPKAKPPLFSRKSQPRRLLCAVYKMA
jgi:hypothetical protein